jgi:hypothetical protein
LRGEGRGEGEITKPDWFKKFHGANVFATGRHCQYAGRPITKRGQGEDDSRAAEQDLSHIDMHTT